MGKLFVVAVIPAKNEQQTISWVVEETKKRVDMVVVVNDGSEDMTQQIAAKAGAFVISHPVSMGAGAATSTGLRYALLKGASTIVTLDGDGQHDPSYLDAMLKAFDGVDLLIGSRDMREGGFWRRLANGILAWEISALAGIRIADSQSGFRIYSRKAAKVFVDEVSEWGYGWASESVLVIARRGLRIAEFPIKAKPHTGKKGTKWWDGFFIFYQALRAGLRRELSGKAILGGNALDLGDETSNDAFAHVGGVERLSGSRARATAHAAYPLHVTNLRGLILDAHSLHLLLLLG
ncbi:glycosyltransferase family 2 protein [Tardisphaera miroshnichenkoae]